MLDPSEQLATRSELAANAALAGLDAKSIATTLGWELPRTESALAVARADPRDVWLVRDLVDRGARARGKTPVAWSRLAEEMRGAAESWFGIADLDEVLAARG